MKERPILFSAPMVRAILAGNKTQTRRVMKPQPAWIGEPSVPFKTPDADPKGIIACTYGQPGDRLWVRESTKMRPFFPGSDAICGAYSADDEPVLNEQGFDLAWWYSKPACPSIHMPRWACRIVLEIVGVRVERLNEISQADTVAEGMRANTGPWVHHTIADFRQLWGEINGKDSWDSNPWVWVVEFKRIDPR